MINGNHSNPNKDVGIRTVNTGNGISMKQELINSVLAALKKYYGGIRATMNEKTLSLWIKDGLFYDVLASDNDRSRDDLISAINNECGLVFCSVEIKKGVPDDDAIEISDGCYMQINQKQTCQTVSRAVITAIAGRGSMIDEQVILDSAEITGLPNARYNIGAGRNPKTVDNSFRVNQIAIDDNPESPEYEKNKYVSRAHAHIEYSENKGFLLYVEHGGSRLAQKRTYVQRGSEMIELADTLVPVQLCDGDYIVLSKYVVLSFKMS